MTRYTYPAIITYYPEDGGTYVVRFPDFPELEVADDNIVDALDGMNSMLSVYVDSIVGEGKSLPESTPFEQHLHQDENCVSWWTIAHCDVDERSKSYKEAVHDYWERTRPLLKAEKESHILNALAESFPEDDNFKRIVDGLNDIAEGNVVIKFDPQDNGIPADEVQADLTVESMNEVLSRYRSEIGWDDMTVEEKSAFHANRPITSGLMNPVGAEPVDHDAYEECQADSKGDDQ